MPLALQVMAGRATSVAGHTTSVAGHANSVTGHTAGVAGHGGSCHQRCHHAAGVAGRATSVVGHAAGVAGHGGAYHQRCRSCRWRCGSRFLAGTWDTAGRWRPIMRCRSPRKTKTCNNRTRTCNRGRAHSATCQVFFAPTGVWRPCQVFVAPAGVLRRCHGLRRTSPAGVAGRGGSCHQRCHHADGIAGRATSVADHSAGVAGHGGSCHQCCRSCHWRYRSCHQCCRSFRWRCGSRFLAGTWDTAGRWRPIMRCRSPGKTKTCNKRTRTCNRGRAHSARTGYPYGAEGYHYGTERRRETTSRGYCIQRASWGMEVRYER